MTLIDPHQTRPDSPADANDVVWGADEIAAVVNRKRRPTYHMLENGLLPARKVGRLWVASRRKLIAHVAGE